MQKRSLIHFLIVVAGLLAACESKRPAEKQNDLTLGEEGIFSYVPV